jgi:hypothetical protein
MNPFHIVTSDFSDIKKKIRTTIYAPFSQSLHIEQPIKSRHPKEPNGQISHIYINPLDLIVLIIKGEKHL